MGEGPAERWIEALAPAGASACSAIEAVKRQLHTFAPETRLDVALMSTRPDRGAGTIRRTPNDGPALWTRFRHLRARMIPIASLNRKPGLA